jgi:hypothetical protein
MNAFSKVDKRTFLRFAAGQAGERYEYVRGRIVQQMTGGTRDHGGVDQPRELSGNGATLCVRGRASAVTLGFADIYRGIV